MFPSSDEGRETPTLLAPLERANLNHWTTHEVRWGYYTTDGQSVSQYVLVSSTLVGLATRYYFLSECCCLKFAVLFLWGALSDERTGLQSAVYSLNGPSRVKPVSILYCLIWDSRNLEGQVPVFISPRNRVAQLYPRALGRSVSHNNSCTNTRHQTESMRCNNKYAVKNCGEACRERDYTTTGGDNLLQKCNQQTKSLITFHVLYTTVRTLQILLITELVSFWVGHVFGTLAQYFPTFIPVGTATGCGLNYRGMEFESL
jgi:hypothetical protein